MIPIYLNALMGLSIVSAFIWTIASFCFAGLDAIQAGNGFGVVLLAMSALAFTCVQLFQLNKRLGAVTYGYSVAVSAWLVITSLATASIVGQTARNLDKAGSPKKYRDTSKAVVAGSALVLIFQAFVLAALIHFKNMFVPAEAPASGYGGQSSTYQPSTYANTYGQEQGGYQAESQNL